MTAPSPELRPRRVNFSWASTPLAWIPGEAQTSLTIDTLHLLLPAGERWFVRVYQRALELIDDPIIAREVRGFMGQEATHARAHQRVIDHLAANGVDATEYLREIDWLFERVLADAPLGKALSPALERRWLVARLALIAALEHYFAFLGGWILDAEALDRAGADETMLAILRWHGAEEVEHRSVAFDAATALGAGYVQRALAMLVTSAVATTLWVRGTWFLLGRSPIVTGPGSFADLRRAGRIGILPTLEELTLQIPIYIRPGFHPSQRGDTAKALAYLRTAPLGGR